VYIGHTEGEVVIGLNGLSLVNNHTKERRYYTLQTHLLVCNYQLEKKG